MPEASRDLGASAEPNKVGPDCFAFYTHEVAELLSQVDEFLPLSSETSELVGRMSGVGGDRAISRHNYCGKDKIVLGSLFCNPTGARLSEIKKERLKELLRQSVIALSQEVDEMLDPVLGIRRIQSHLKYKKSLSNYSGVQNIILRRRSSCPLRSASLCMLVPPVASVQSCRNRLKGCRSYPRNAILAQKCDENAIPKRKSRAPKEDGSLSEQIGHT